MKNDHFSIKQKQQKYPFLPLWFLKKLSSKNQTSTIIIKFSPCSNLEMTFFVHILFPSVDTAFCSSAFEPSRCFQHLDRIACWEITRIFDSTCPFPQFFHIQKSTATPTHRQKFMLVVIFRACKFQNMGL